MTIEDCNAYSVFAIGSAASPAVGDNALEAVIAVDGTARPSTPPTDTLPVAGGTAGGLPIGLLALAAIAFLGSVALLARRNGTDRNPAA